MNEYGARLAYKNYLNGQSASISLTSTVGGTDVFPLDNLKIRQLSEVWKRTDIGDLDTLQVSVTFAEPTGSSLGLLALLDFRWGQDESQIRDRLNDEGQAPTVSVNCWKGVTLAVSKSFPLYNYAAANIKDLPFNYFLKFDPADDVIDGDMKNITKIMIEFNNASTGLTYYNILQMGRLWFGPALVFPKGCDVGWELLHVDSGTLTTSQGNQSYENRKVRSRRASCNISLMDSLTAYGFSEDATVEDLTVPSLQAAAYAVGLTSEAIWLPRTMTGLWMHRTGIYGHFGSPIKISQYQGGQYMSAIDMVEEC